jgi:hypothetical protein
LRRRRSIRDRFRGLDLLGFRPLLAMVQDVKCMLPIYGKDDTGRAEKDGQRIQRRIIQQAAG